MLIESPEYLTDIASLYPAAESDGSSTPTEPIGSLFRLKVNTGPVSLRKNEHVRSSYTNRCTRDFGTLTR